MNENIKKKEINLYYLKSQFEDVVQKLLKKLLDQKQNIIVNLNDEDEVIKLDKFLWIKDKNSFLPHKKISEELTSLDRVVLSSGHNTKNENIKRFDQIIFSPSVKIEKFNFFRRFFVFSYEKINNISLTNIKDKLSSKGFKVSCYFEYDKFKWKLK